MTTNALIRRSTTAHRVEPDARLPSSCFTTSTARVQVAGVLLGDAGDSRRRASGRHARAELDRRAVRADDDRRRRSRCRAAPRPRPRARPRRRGRRNRARARARRAGPRRAAGSGGAGARRGSARRGVGAAGRCRRRRGVGGHVRRRGPASGARSPSVVEREAAEELLRELLEDDRSVRRELDAEPRGELRDPGELVRARGRSRHGAGAARGPRGSSSSRRARALAVAGRTRSAQPTASPWNIVTAITLSACSASARTPGSAAASSPETTSSSMWLGVRLVRVGCRRPGSRPRRGRSASPEGGTRRSRACSSKPSACASSAMRAPPPPPGPDQTRTARSAARSRSPRAFSRRGEVACRARRPRRAQSARSRRRPIVTISAPRRRACLIQRSTIGARSTTGSSPTTTTSSASPIAESGSRNASSASRRRLGEHRRVRAEPAAQEPAERVRDARSSPSPRARSRPRPRPRAAASRPRRAPSSQDDRLEPLRAAPRAACVIRSLARQVRVGEAALVAEPAAVDLRVVARQDPLDLPLAVVAEMLQPTGQTPAHRRHVLDVPGARLEAVLRRGQRARPGTARRRSRRTARGRARPRTSRSRRSRRGCAR